MPLEHSNSTPERNRALVKLLGDDDPKISGVAWEHLEKIGPGVLPELEEASRDSDDPRVRTQARRFLAEWSRREVFRRWVKYCRAGCGSLEEGVFLVAQSEYPQVAVETYQQTLDAYGEVLRKRIRSARTNGEAVAKVVHFLFDEKRFRGNEDDYENPDNSYLTRVMEVRKGIPVSLAVLFLLVARRLPLQVYGVGMPRHFLLKYADARGEVFLDVFRGGRLLTARDCARFLRDSGITFREKYLRAISDRQILQRLLGNLLRIYHVSEDERRVSRVAAMLKLIE